MQLVGSRFANNPCTPHTRRQCYATNNTQRATTLVCGSVTCPNFERAWALAPGWGVPLAVMRDAWRDAAIAAADAHARIACDGAAFATTLTSLPVRFQEAVLRSVGQEPRSLPSARPPIFRWARHVYRASAPTYARRHARSAWQRAVPSSASKHGTNTMPLSATAAAAAPISRPPQLVCADSGDGENMWAAPRRGDVLAPRVRRLVCARTPVVREDAVDAWASRMARAREAARLRAAYMASGAAGDLRRLREVRVCSAAQCVT